MHSLGAFANTVVLFLADHGHRSSAIRQTVVGLMEERLPFLGLFLPPALRKRFPHIARNVQDNTKSWP